MTLVGSLQMSSFASWAPFVLNGLCLKTCKVSSEPIEEQPSANSSEPLVGSGIAWAGVILTADISESPNAAVECLLSDTLETGDHLRPFFLSPQQRAKFLARFKKHGLEIPDAMSSDGPATKRRSGCPNVLPLFDPAREEKAPELPRAVNFDD